MVRIRTAASYDSRNLQPSHKHKNIAERPSPENSHCEGPVLVQTSKVAQTDGRLKVLQVALGTLGDEETSREIARCRGEKTL